MTQTTWNLPGGRDGRRGGRCSGCVTYSERVRGRRRLFWQGGENWGCFCRELLMLLVACSRILLHAWDRQESLLPGTAIPPPPLAVLYDRVFAHLSRHLVLLTPSTDAWVRLVPTQEGRPRADRFELLTSRTVFQLAEDLLTDFSLWFSAAERSPMPVTEPSRPYGGDCAECLECALRRDSGESPPADCARFSQSEAVRPGFRGRSS